jgi:hypothetical protein
MIAHSQVGYAPDFSKVAVLELDPKYNGPKTAKVLRLMEDGAPAAEGIARAALEEPEKYVRPVLYGSISG